MQRRRSATRPLPGRGAIRSQPEPRRPQASSRRPAASAPGSRDPAYQDFDRCQSRDAACAVVPFTRSRAHALITTVLSDGLESAPGSRGPPVGFVERAAAVRSSARISIAAGDPCIEPHSGVRYPAHRSLPRRPAMPAAGPHPRNPGQTSATSTSTPLPSRQSDPSHWPPFEPAPRPTD